MITSRFLTEEDRLLLEESLKKDEYHNSTTEAGFFYTPDSVCNVFERDGKPVFFIRGTKALRIDIQFVDNNDKRANAEALLVAYDDIRTKAKAAGFTELIFNSQSPRLIAFCKKYLGFIESEGELRNYL